MPRPLDYATPPRRDGGPSSAGGWAFTLALAAAALDGLTLLVGLQGGGTGFAFDFPCFCLGVPAGWVLSLAATLAAVGALHRRRGRDVLAWLAVALALGTAAGGWVLLQWAFEAVAAV